MTARLSARLPWCWAADVTHDETAGIQTDGGKDDVALESAPAAFNAIEGEPIGIAQVASAASVTGSANYGADSNGTTQVTGFTLTGSSGGTFNGAATNLTATGGNAIFLYTEDGLLVGREGTSEGSANAEGDVVFALHIDSTGKVTLAQYQAIDHGADEDFPAG